MTEVKLPPPKMHIAMVGTRGVPAHYGGFETAIEEIGQRLTSRGHDVTVYCRTSGDDQSPKLKTFRGMNLVHLPALKRQSLETLSHTGLSVFHMMANRPDVAIVFNAANAPWLPMFRVARVPVVTHVDGLEWKRDKWGPVGQRYYLLAERLSVRWSDALIADAPGISQYYAEKFEVPTEGIAYGAPIVQRQCGRLSELGLSEQGYHLVVARFEPENHVDVIVDGYRQSGAHLPLVVVGSAPYADQYTRKVHDLADDRVQFLGGVWDQELLDQLYAGAASYLHGHSVGGTNPSLLRAMGAGAAIDAFDVNFNHDVLRDSGRFFSDASDVAALVESTENDLGAARKRGDRGQERAADYSWDTVTDHYEALCEKLYARDVVKELAST